MEAGRDATETRLDALAMRFQQGEITREEYDRLETILLTETPTKADTPPAAQPGKTCPMCAEQVHGAARVCRFCGYRFDAPMAAASADEETRRTNRRMIYWGWGFVVVGALAPPLLIVPAVLGIILLTKSELSNGSALIAFAVVIFFVRLAMYASTGFQPVY